MPQVRVLGFEPHQTVSSFGHFSWICSVSQKVTNSDNFFRLILRSADIELERASSVLWRKKGGMHIVLKERLDEEGVKEF